MEIHELNTFSGTLGAGDFFATDNGNDTSRVSAEAMFEPLNTRIDNIIAGPSSSAQEVIDARLGANGITYSSLGDAIRDQIGALNDDIDFIGIEKTLSNSGGNASAFNSGIDGFTYAYLLNDDGVPMVVPKGGKISKFRCLTPSSATHSINIYFLKRVISGYSLHYKLENVDITGSKYIDLSALEFTTQCYIAVSNYTNYALRYSETPVSGATNVKNLVSPVSDIGENKVAVFTQASQRYYGFDVEILKPTKPITYTVGAGKDFTYFTAMLRALENNTDEKIVYVDEGVYDIYNEKGGADFIASISNPASVNWRDVCEVVPDNTTIIGKGKVVLRWNPPANVIGSDAMAFLFSPLNVSGSCHIENIEIECTNCRYAIHDETSNYERWKYVERTYRNVRAKKTHGTYGNSQLYAAGLSQMGNYTFEDCYFESDRYWMFSMHSNTMAENDKVLVNLKNCIFVRSETAGYQNTDMIGFGNTNTIKRYIEVKFDNCWLNGNIMLYAEGDLPGAVNAFSVITLGCNAVSITPNGVTNDQLILQKNNFSN